MSDHVLKRQVDAMRRFNRFYTKKIGVLKKNVEGSTLSLTEVRVLYELAHNPNLTASDIIELLQLDAGYLSRILQNLIKNKYIIRRHSSEDKRFMHISLTKKGEQLFNKLNKSTNIEVSDLLSQVPDNNRHLIIEAMQTIETHMNGASTTTSTPPPPYLLRAHQSGDMGWIVYRHGVIYAPLGYDLTFEALVAEICAKFIHNFDPKRERCWMAEQNGTIIGTVMLVKQTNTTAKLRLLLVEPATRGMGVGSRLVEECTRFAREAGYKKVVLWTQSELLEARRIYKNAGYCLIKEEPHHSFGKDLVAETWELKL